VVGAVEVVSKRAIAVDAGVDVDAKSAAAAYHVAGAGVGVANGAVAVVEVVVAAVVVVVGIGEGRGSPLVAADGCGGRDARGELPPENGSRVVAVAAGDKTGQAWDELGLLLVLAAVVAAAAESRSFGVGLSEGTTTQKSLRAVGTAPALQSP